MKNKIIYSALLVFMLVLSACGSAAQTAMPVSTAAPVIPITNQATDTPASAVMPGATDTMVPPAAPTSPTVVNVGQNTTIGSFLVDSMGMTLYIYTKDTPGTSTCYGGCATIWPPLLTNGAPTSGMGVTASMLGTTTRSDGTVQVTYNGWPLYYFAKDKVAGDTTGEGVQSVWYVMTPAGTQK
jgi:predicted lipoprotein with Yx(FWY)xxD motif